MAVKTEAEVKPAQTLRGPALVAALLALLLWALFVIVMIEKASTATEVFWSRLAFLFASVEAVAFAAGGAIWGASIQRERAEKAEASAAANQQDAARGRALATSLIAEAKGGAEVVMAPGVQRMGGEIEDVAKRHADLARSLFPDV